MQDESRPFSVLRAIEPPSTLLERVVRAVERARLHRLRLQGVWMMVGTVGCIGYLFLYLNAFREEMAASSFFEWIRLAFSDPDIIWVNAKDFVLGLLEAIPLGFILFVACGLLLIMGGMLLLDAFRHARRRVSA